MRAIPTYLTFTPKPGANNSWYLSQSIGLLWRQSPSDFLECHNAQDGWLEIDANIGLIYRLKLLHGRNQSNGSTLEIQASIRSILLCHLFEPTRKLLFFIILQPDFVLVEWS